MVWSPAGFARGFCSLADDTEIQYKCTGLYNSKAEGSIRWNDPEIGIAWPLSDVVVSSKDSAACSLSDWLASPASDNFVYSPTAELCV
jgi:dTDP-4-dehydrorhamnose 3,5-epimerase